MIDTGSLFPVQGQVDNAFLFDHSGLLFSSRFFLLLLAVIDTGLIVPVQGHTGSLSVSILVYKSAALTHMGLIDPVWGHKGSLCVSVFFWF